jgi:hypothetical protein
VLALAPSACGSHFDGMVYRNDDLAFAVGATPTSWRPIDVSDARLAYRDDSRDATIALHARCGKDGDDVPLKALTQHLFIHFTDREVLSQQVVSLDGREAMRTLMHAKLDGVPRRFLVYVLKKDGCVYDFLYISRPQTLDLGMADFDRFVEAFRTLSD